MSGVGDDQLKLFQNDSPPPTPNALSPDTLLALWHSSFIVEGHATRMEADFARQRGEQLMQHFFDWWEKEERDVLAVEKGFSLAMDGLKLTGRFDRVEAAGDGVRVIDYKTTKPRPQEEVDADLQLSIYALACQEVFSKPCTELVFLFLNEEGVTERVTHRTESALRDAKKQILALHKNIEEKDFHPTPSKEVCRRCPYKGVCDVAAIKEQRQQYSSAPPQSHTPLPHPVRRL